MARFVYRLQKVFELRERKKKEHEQRVVDAQKRVREVELAIEEKRNEIRMVHKSMLTSPHTMMAAHDEFIHHLNEQLEELHQELARAKEILEYERQLLIKAQADLEALIKHQDKAREEWLDDEKRREMKMLDEVAGQRYFRAKLQAEIDLAEEVALAQAEAESADDYVEY